MDKALFNDFLQSLQEADTMARGTATSARRFEVVVSDVKTLRERVHLSQRDFSTRIPVRIKARAGHYFERPLPLFPLMDRET
ncbi:MAG: transcriptional regulator [Gammaproteobacteria bacterium]|nr:transcriptional regulator [Gammaproteobacteria bacterium]